MRAREPGRCVDRAATPPPRPHPRPAAEDIRVLLRDRGPNVTASFEAVVPATGAGILISAVPAPRRNTTCERLIGALRRAVLDRILILGERHLRAVVTGHQVHDDTGRPHQGIAPRAPDEEPDVARATLTDTDRQQIRRKAVLGGLINEYTHAA